MSPQDHGLETGLDMALIPRCAPALPFGNAKPVPVYIEAEALNTQRAIGTTLSHEARPVLMSSSQRARCTRLHVGMHLRAGLHWEQTRWLLYFCERRLLGTPRDSYASSVSTYTGCAMHRLCL